MCLVLASPVAYAILPADTMASPLPNPDYTVDVIGAPRRPLKDLYHAYLEIPWAAAIGLIVVAYLALNAIFALAYLGVGGLNGVHDGSFADCYYFSVQTLGTIGYGSVYPVSRAANLVVVAESVTGLLTMALATGLVFSKFARSSSRMVFSRQVAFSPVDGVPTLQLRLGNERGNRIIDSRIRVVLARTEITLEGTTLYRMYDLALIRDRMPVLTRSWTVMHKVVPGSPLFGKTPEDLAREEVELIVTLVGIDDTSMQQVHANHRYMDRQISWGARHADILHEESPTRVILDLRKFHDLLPTAPIDGFPYPEKPRASP
jgi:inward rectifier potassium channel